MKKLHVFLICLGVFLLGAFLLIFAGFLLVIQYQNRVKENTAIVQEKYFGQEIEVKAFGLEPGQRLYLKVSEAKADWNYQSTGEVELYGTLFITSPNGNKFQYALPSKSTGSIFVVWEAEPTQMISNLSILDHRLHINITDVQQAP